VGRGDDGDVFEVFGRGAHHGRAADVDVLDEVFKSYAGVGCRLFEGVEVNDDHVDGLDAGGLGLVAVLAEITVDLLQVLVDLMRVVATHDPGEVALRSFLEEVAELSIDVGLHVA